MTQMAIYPGTFDPITNGHLDIIRRGAVLFDQVIVAVANSARKSPRFLLEDRIAMCEQALSDLANVRVQELKGMTVDFAKQQQVQFILRGLRGITDFDYERQIAHMNQQLSSGMETVFLSASEATSFVSGTMVREIMDVGGDVSAFVPASVIPYLQK